MDPMKLTLSRTSAIEKITMGTTNWILQDQWSPSMNHGGKNVNPNTVIMGKRERETAVLEVVSLFDTIVSFPVFI